MHLAEGLEVYIKSTRDDKKYEEYDKPGEASSETKYIEAQDGGKFAIVIHVSESFKFFKSSALQIMIQAEDGSLVDNVFLLAKDSLAMHKPEVIDSFDYHRDGQKFEGEFVFGTFDLDEDMSMGEDEVKEQAERLGRIEIVIRRGTHKIDPRKHTKPNKEERSAKMGKEIMKDHGITHFIRSGEPTPIGDRDTDVQLWDFTPLRGKNGTPFQCVFRYCARYILARMGIVPPSPIIRPCPQVLPHFVDGDEHESGGAAGSGSVETARSNNPEDHDSDLGRPTISGSPEMTRSNSTFQNGNHMQNADDREPGTIGPVRIGNGEIEPSGCRATHIKREYDPGDSNNLYDDSEMDEPNQTHAAKRAKTVNGTGNERPELQAPPESTMECALEAADTDPETRQEELITTPLHDNPALDIVEISDDETEVTHIKEEDQRSHCRCGASRITRRVKQEENVEDNKEDLELQLRKINIQLQLNRLRRSGQ